MKKFSIDIKLTLWYALSMTVILVFTVSFILYLNRKVTLDSIQKKLVDIVREASKEIECYNDIENITDSDDIYIKYRDGYIEIDDDYLSETKSVYTALYNEQKILIYGDTPLLNYHGTMPDFSEEIKQLKVGGIHYYIYDMNVESEVLSDLWVRGVVAKTEELRGITYISIFALCLLPLIMLFSIISGYAITKSALKPIENIRQTALHISNGRDLSKHIDIGEGEDELHKLVDVFNDMLDRLARSFEREKRFASDASHELRTPMAVIMAECEYLSSENMGEPLHIEEYKEGIEVIHRQSKRMTAIIKDLLDFTRLGKNIYEKSSVNISDLLEGICEDMQRLHIQDIQLKKEIEKEVFVYANQDLLYRMLMNIINNAYTYGKEKGMVEVKLFLKNKKVYISIQDDGIGISPKDKQHIFERFYRADSSHTGKGTGLGLAMALEIARWHGGDIVVESELGKGSVFQIVLPILI